MSCSHNKAMIECKTLDKSNIPQSLCSGSHESTWSNGRALAYVKIRALVLSGGEEIVRMLARLVSSSHLFVYSHIKPAAASGDTKKEKGGNLLSWPCLNRVGARRGRAQACVWMGEPFSKGREYRDTKGCPGELEGN